MRRGITRASAATLELTAPPASRVVDDVRLRIRDRLVSDLATSIGELALGEQVEITLPLLRRAVAHPEPPAAREEPFAWKPIFVRRSLGLALVNACATGRFRSPCEGAGPVAADAVTEWRRTGWRTFHWEPWFAGLPLGARAVVLADAVGWASAVWSSFDWSGFAALPQIGGADDQWTCPALRTIRLKARSEMRVPLTTSGPAPRGDQCATRQVALVSVSGGSPADGWPDELAYLALVAGLGSPSRPVPARVMGLWPDAGLRLTVDIDESALEGAAARVSDAVKTFVGARLSVDAPC